MSKIAITGTIASGKTSVSIILRELGYYVYDCDAYNAYLLEKGNKGYLEVKNAFPECFHNDELDKKVLASIIFNDVSKKKELENILHPLIIENMLIEASKHEPFFAEVPLLFENGLEKYFDVSVLVVAYKKDCIKRLIDKGYSKKEAIQRINNQMDVKIKRQKADRIIYNKNNFASLKEEVLKLLDDIC